jgi:hypothetical protein
MVKMALVPEEQHFTLASRAQRRLALAVVLALLGAFFIAAGPLSTIQSRRIDAFDPAYATAMFVNDSITAVLLFADVRHGLCPVEGGRPRQAVVATLQEPHRINRMGCSIRSAAVRSGCDRFFGGSVFGLTGQCKGNLINVPK